MAVFTHINHIIIGQVQTLDKMVVFFETEVKQNRRTLPFGKQLSPASTKVILNRSTIKWSKKKFEKVQF